MRALLPSLTEIVFLAALWLLGLLVAMPLRRRARPAGGAAHAPLSTPRALFVYASRPAAVLLLTWLALAARDNLAAAGGWTWMNPAHLDAWVAFWSCILALAVAEGVGRHVYERRGQTLPIPDLLMNIARAALVLLAAFLVLKFQLGVNIAPLLASTALVTAVIGFALQGVLGNLLSGLSLHLTRSVVPTDWVRIDDVEGEVIQTNWRETRLRSVAGHVFVIPNTKVAEAKVQNMTRPDPLRRHAVDVGASYTDAPGEVIEALVESALSVPEVLREPAPTAVLAEFKDFGVNYQLRFWSRRYFDRSILEGDVRRMVWYQFHRRGLEIPFPMSDKLLNDLVEVIQHQRHMPSSEEELRAVVSDLHRSDLCTKLCVDDAGAPLLREPDLDALSREVRRQRYTRGEALFRQGEAGGSFYVLVRGIVGGSVEHADGTPPAKFELQPGAVFGEMSLMTGLPRMATMTAAGEVEVLEVGPEAFKRLLGAHERVPEILSRLAAARAASNAEAYSKLKSMNGVNVADSLHKDGVLARLMRLIGRRA